MARALTRKCAHYRSIALFAPYALLRTRTRLACALSLSLAVCGVLAVLTMTGCGSSGPPASLTVVQAADLGAIGNNPKILGGDGGYSGVFAGNSVKVCGDTFLATPNADGDTLIRGCAIEVCVGIRR